MSGGDGFHLVGVYVETGNQDHVLLAILDEYIAALIHAADIARAQPSAGKHYLRGLVGAVPIARGDLRTPHADLTNFSDGEVIAGIVLDGDIGRGDGQTDRSVEIFTGRVDASAR